MDNAIEYTSEGGSVAASAGGEGMYETIVVRDTGIRLSAEDRYRVFEEIYRVLNERT